MFCTRFSTISTAARNIFVSLQSWRPLLKDSRLETCSKVFVSKEMLCCHSESSSSSSSFGLV